MTKSDGGMQVCADLYYLCREVFKARHKKTKKVVALKKVLMENEKEGVSSKDKTSCYCKLYNIDSICTGIITIITTINIANYTSNMPL